MTGAVVEVELLKHNFRFGGVLNAASLSKNEEKYKDVFLKMGFNSAGFNNALKYKLWKGQQKHQPGKIIEWLHSNDISVRGHCLIWPGMSQGGSRMPKELIKLLEKKAPKSKIKSCCEKIIRESARKWDVCEWDVINETRGNHIIQDLLGKEVEADWFRVAQKYSRNREIKLYLNENRVISDPPQKKRVFVKENGKRKKKFEYVNEVNSKNMKLYYENVKELLRNGAPINALGFQSRFGYKNSPEIIYDRLCVFNEFALPITATEFEMKTTIGEEIDKAEMTERVMTIYFSHKLVSGIYVWTIFPGSSSEGREEGREILNSAGKPNLRGKVWLYLTKNHWKTHEKIVTNSSGTVKLRGFKGYYLIKVNNKLSKHEITKNKKINIEI